MLIQKAKSFSAVLIGISWDRSAAKLVKPSRNDGSTKSNIATIIRNPPRFCEGHRFQTHHVQLFELIDRSHPDSLSQQVCLAPTRSPAGSGGGIEIRESDHGDIVQESDIGRLAAISLDNATLSATVPDRVALEVFDATAAVGQATVGF
jgi:hypothetical protein